METGRFPSRARRFPSSLGLWTLWVLASIAGAALAVLVIYSVLFIGKRLLGGFDEDRYGTLVLVPSLALLIGAAQWLVLRPRLPRAYWWPIVTAAGWALFVGLVRVVGPLVPPSLAGGMGVTSSIPLLGICIGLCQWLYLRRQVSSAGWWVLASILGWSILTLMVVIVRVFPLEWQLVYIGLVPSLVTGGALVWLLRRSGASELRTDDAS